GGGEGLRTAGGVVGGTLVVVEGKSSVGGGTLADGSEDEGCGVVKEESESRGQLWDVVSALEFERRSRRCKVADEWSIAVTCHVLGCSSPVDGKLVAEYRARIH